VRRLARPLLFAACALPLAWLVARVFGFAGAGLGANPIDELMDRLGEWGLRLLIATLCVTPLAVTLRKSWLMGLRRMLGLFAFTYLCLHFLTWLVLDQWFDLDAIGADLVKRPYITVGFTAFALLVPLAVTHFWWQVKADWREPAVHAVLLAGLLAWRVRRARRRTASPGAVVASG